MAGYARPSIRFLPYWSGYTGLVTLMWLCQSGRNGLVDWSDCAGLVVVVLVQFNWSGSAGPVAPVQLYLSGCACTGPVVLAPVRLLRQQYNWPFKLGI